MMVVPYAVVASLKEAKAGKYLVGSTTRRG